ncbi:FAD-dependent oxidoreductase [Pseudooceanicola sp. GBMRC 2024]|uniref:FAD-dependent oxidoreductase n=1 Tax=Pseudooceanicola albus TaxID=2692189 RepID=A0A6L7G229_9RHOB|nr:FAD-dependent oxidoreductase [Pseudooceanicola albus]MXN17939.1 FAD-dependent oxidoreductase [Pseudooceanicola albus]
MSAEESYDVVIIGSGSAACSAALRAAKGGLTVLVIEKSDKLGGTSAMSGAGIWIPANHVAERAGIADSRDEALAYLRGASPEGWAETEDGLWQAFVEHGPDMLRFLEENTPLDLRLIEEPDPMVEVAGGKLRGRMVSPMPLSRNLLGADAKWLRRSTLPHSFTYQEITDHDVYHHPIMAGMKLWPKLLWRKLTNRGGQGTALMTGLIRGCKDAGVTFRREVTATRLLQDEMGGIAGVEVSDHFEARRLMARRGVVIASGGFEWDAALRSRHFPGKIDRIGSPRSNTGDGQRMAAEVGARLERMDQANIYPCLPTKYEGHRHGLPMTYQTEPHSIIVNRHGRRFCSETDFNIGEYLDARDPQTGENIHLPCFLIGDRRMLKGSLPFLWYQSYEKGWVKRAKTLPELAEKLGLPTEALAETVTRFNGFCETGVDADFGRGDSAWESYKAHASGPAPASGPEAAAAKGLGRIEEGDFVGMVMNLTTIGTKGGARCNAKGQALRADGSIITGLYAAGLAMANPIGTRAVGAGTTIGPNMTWGYIAAETMLAQNR